MRRAKILSISLIIILILVLPATTFAGPQPLTISETLTAVPQLTLIPPTPTPASTPTFTASLIRSVVDGRIVFLMWPSIQSHQDTYFAVHGHYWQGLPTHSDVPTNGNEYLPDVGSLTPTDQLDPWPILLIGTTMPMALEINVYDGPNGSGYEVVSTVQIDGQMWRRVFQVGSEVWREYAWSAVNE